MSFEPRAPGFEDRVRASFERQTVMATIGATVEHVAPGEVDVALPYRYDLTQQHDFIHAGIISAIVDSACGYAAYTLMEPDCGVLTVEFKVNLMAPAAGERFVARGRVVRPGRTLTVSRGSCTAYADGRETVVAEMQATIMQLTDRPGVKG